MLIQDFVQVDAPFAVVRDRLLSSDDRHLTEDASAAYAEGEHLLLAVGGAPGEPMAGPGVQIDLGAAYSRGEGVVVPMNWWVPGAHCFFPTLDADLEIMPFGARQVILTLMGRYQPPLGAVGRGLDRLVMHRVVATSVRTFLRRTAVNLETATAA